MDNLTKTLLAGAAMGALATAPALAAPNAHIAGVNNAALAVKNLGTHIKTPIHDPHVNHVTQTVSFAGTISEAGFINKPTILWGEAWFSRTGTTSSSKCTDAPNQSAKFQKTTAAAVIKHATETGSASIPGFCALNTGMTFYGPKYKLTSTTATHDSFTGKIIANEKLVSGYIYTLKANTSLNITH